MFPWLLAALVSATIGTPSIAAENSPLVSTIAGDGSAGSATGLAMTSSFTEPSGVAVASDGTVYITDAATGLILRIRNGIVQRIAGRATGYADGPDATAQFNRPLGIAVARDGTLFVADSDNHCIRKISGGTVSTFAGSQRLGNQDGKGQVASFNRPLSVAIDDAGYVYVADFGNGIRKIAPDGSVSTIDLPEPNPKVLAVAVRGSGNNLVIAYTDTTAVHLGVEGEGVKSLKATDWREPYGEGFTIGYSYGVAIIDSGDVVVTDLLNNAVRFIRFGSMTVRDSHTLAGGVREGSDAIGGYRDGHSETALVDVPLGIARAPDGSLVVADTGNRRIRRITGLDSRGPVPQGFQGLVGPKNSYRVALLGNSYIWSSVMWPDSIAGQIEAGLLHHADEFGLKSKPFVSIARLNAAGVSSLRSVAQNYLADGEADLVIIFLNHFTQVEELAQRPELKGDDWRTVVPKELRELDHTLNSQHTKLLIVWMPSPWDVSLLEAPKYYTDVGGSLFDPNSQAKSDAEVAAIYLGAGVRAISLTQPMQLTELSSRREIFFQSADPHMTAAGQTWVGKAVLHELEQWKPWTAK